MPLPAAHDTHPSVARLILEIVEPPQGLPYKIGVTDALHNDIHALELSYSALDPEQRAGFVVVSSASDARGSQLDLRRQLIQTGAVDVMLSLGSNVFGDLPLPVTLWFLDKAKAMGDRKDKILFLDARHIYQQVNRRRRGLLPVQIEYLANIVRMYRGAALETVQGSGELLKKTFPKGTYMDVPGVCKVATLKEIEAQGWSLNPGRYVGVATTSSLRLIGMRLRDVYGFQNLDLRFPEGQAAVLIGTNGAGKSTVLDSIAMFLAPLSAELRNLDRRKAPYGLTAHAIHIDADHAEAELDVEGGGRKKTWHISADRTGGKPAQDPRMARWAYRLYETLETTESTSVPVLCYYPAIRFYVQEGSRKRRAKPAALEFPQLAAYDNAFEIGQQSFDGVVGWFRREEDLENEVRLGGSPEHVNPLLEGVRQAVLRFMDALSQGTFDDMRVRRDPKEPAKARLVLRKEGKELPLDALSDGERGSILLVADLAQRLAAANPDAPDPLSGPGVVLIDEIELHLHPRWQRGILPALTETFRGCQFIVTTHSPQVLSRVPREQILLLSKFHLVAELPYTEGRDTNAILSELMGVARRPEDAAAEIDELARLIDDEDFEGARRKLVALEGRFGPNDRDLLRLGAMLRTLEEDRP